MQGKGVSDGIAIGNITIYSRQTNKYSQTKVRGVKSEIARFNTARKNARQAMLEFCELAKADKNITTVELIESHLVLIEDEGFIMPIKEEIRKNKRCCEQAIIMVSDRLCLAFSEMEDPYLQARADDIRDISDRIIKELGSKETLPQIKENTILIADDLSPSETVLFDRNKILAFVTKRGSKLSHTAILAKSLGIPAMVGIDFNPDWDGMLAIVDANTGKLIIDPDEKTINEYKKKQEESKKRAESLKALINLPPVTKSGKHIGLLANVGSLNGIKTAVENGCEGIGLLRSEFIYIESDDYPSEEKQYQLYSSAIKMLHGKELTIRTIDLGGDKIVPYMQMKHEKNPAMGMRAIRYCLGHKDVFKTQLRAILRASVNGPVSILLPMIISIEEIWQVKSLLNEVCEDLRKKNIPFGSYKLGIMIETPAAAILSDLLAHEVDFFSIGTNDLTQYTLAVDRQNSELEFICDYHHQAIIRMLQTIIRNGHDGDCRVCVCGELAADTSFTHELIKMGVDELSVATTSLLRVKQAIRDVR